MIAVPAMACSMPPPGMPGGRSMLVKKERCSTAGRPRATVYESTRPRGISASSAVR